jgi:hypothetical protein
VTVVGTLVPHASSPASEGSSRWASNSVRWNPWNDALAPRLAPAWRAAVALLLDGAAHGSGELIAAMTSVGSQPIQPKTAGNLLRQGRRRGWLAGTYLVRRRRRYLLTPAGIERHRAWLIEAAVSAEEAP